MMQSIRFQGSWKVNTNSIMGLQIPTEQKTAQASQMSHAFQAHHSTISELPNTVSFEFKMAAAQEKKPATPQLDVSIKSGDDTFVETLTPHSTWLGLSSESTSALVERALQFAKAMCLDISSSTYQPPRKKTENKEE